MKKKTIWLLWCSNNMSDDNEVLKGGQMVISCVRFHSTLRDLPFQSDDDHASLVTARNALINDPVTPPFNVLSPTLRYASFQSGALSDTTNPRVIRSPLL